MTMNARRRALRLAAIPLALYAGLPAASALANEPPRATPAGATQAADDALVERLYRLDRLPRFKQPASIGMFSSYDRTGGNDDGFNGTYSYLRKEDDGLVIAEMVGPGAITRIWTPTPTDDLVEFYFDGEATPRIRVKMNDLFNGERFPFLAPLSGVGAGGFYTYVPLVYERSMKVVVRADRVNFYQINYETFADGRGVDSYSPENPAFRARLAKANAVLAASGSDVSATVAGGAAVRSHETSGTLAAGARATLFESTRPGRVVGLTLSPASAFATPARDLLLNIYYDGEDQPAVSVPVGDLFGYAWGEPAVRSLLVGTAGDANYLYMPMPFDRGIRIELQSERADGAIAYQAEVKHSDEGRRADEGRFYAVWKRENPTTTGTPYTILDTVGRGHLAGIILQAQGTEPGAVPEYFEGDDTTTIDGVVRIRGTGSEDLFNGGWYDVPGRWADRVSLPLSGSLDYKRHLARTGGYRLFLSDPYPFERSLLQTIEHGPVGNALTADYSSVAMLYADRAPPGAGRLPPVADRAVIVPREIVFTPGWTTPIEAFSWSNATLAKADDRIGGENLRHLQFRATGREVFGPHYLMFDCEMPAAGRYGVFIQAIAGPAQGRVQLFHNELPVGEPADLYAAERTKTAEIAMGELTLDQGRNPIMFKIVGKDDRSSGLGFDAYRIVFRKIG